MMNHTNEQTVLGSPDRFGYEWATYNSVLPEHRAQLIRWLGQHSLESFRGKSVLDVGCGMGRNSYWIAKEGASRVVAVDVDDQSLKSARKNLAAVSNASVQKASVYDLAKSDLGTFERVVCIGVLHHLADPRAALDGLWSRVAPGGTLVLWCYGKDGNSWILPIIQICRAVGSRIPVRQAHFLAKIISRLSWPIMKRLPWRTEYFKNIKTLSYSNFESIVFDQMLPKIAHYWTAADLEALVAPLGGQNQIEQVQGNSWAVRVTRT